MRQEFDQILDSLQAQATGEATAYQVERDLFAQLLALGKMLLEVFFALCAERSGRRQARSADGTLLRVHSWKPRRYVSLFGETRIERPYFWAKGEGGQVPMDATLSLPDDTYSDLLREHADFMSAQMAYGKAAAMIKELLGLSLSPSALRRLVERDAEEVVAFYDDFSPPAARTEAPIAGAPIAGAPIAEAPILVAEADGKGVPMRPVPGKHGDRSPGDRSPVRLGKGQKRTKKKEAVVTSLYATEKRVRTAEEVLDSFFSSPSASARSDPAGSDPAGSDPQEEGFESESPQSESPQNKKVWATLKGKTVAFERLADQVRRRDGPHVTDRVALSDGCKALQGRFREQFPRFQLILDFVHVSEYLWKAANALFEEASEARLTWVIERSRELLTGRLEETLATLRRESERKDDACAQVCAQVARYFQRNAERMHYKRYLEKGWPIATGVIEGACRHLVKDRCETSGMRWRVEGAEQVLGLRAVWANGDWETYHQHRRETRHRRLYGGPLEATDTLEKQMWQMAA